jgi:glycosyltransferase involved in cell wall biosynthesis
MRIGVVVQSPEGLGGASNYENQFVALMQLACAELGHETLIFRPSGFATKGADSSQEFFRASNVRFALAHARSNFLIAEMLKFIGLGFTHLERQAARAKVDILIFASPNHLSPGIRRIPIATTAWDFGHLDLPQGAETSLGGLWNWREELYATTAARSVSIFCDSERTKSRLVSRYGCEPSRIYKIGLLPTVPDGISPVKFDRPHLIYPATFWPHKNHEILLLAFRDLLEKNPASAFLVFTGGGESKAKIEAKAADFGIDKHVRFEGLVSRDRLFGLIAGSHGLLMPSLLGPSNLPQLEASLIGIPVAMSDRHVMPDLLEGAKLISAQDSSEWLFTMEKMLASKLAPARAVEVPVANTLKLFLKFVDLETAPWRSHF